MGDCRNIKFEHLQECDLKETWELCMKSFNENFSYKEVQDTWELCKNDKHYHFIVGKCNGKIVAYTTMIVFHDLFDGLRPIATLWYVCVDEQYRRKGIAGKMFKYLENIAEQHNCEIIYFTCLKDNFGAQKFYRSAGYSDEKEKAFVKYFFEEQ